MRDKLLAQKIGLAIRNLRHQAGWSQEDFADLCHLHRTYVGLIERGERAISIETASKLASALGLTLSQLFAEVELEADTVSLHTDSQHKEPPNENNVPAE